MVNVERKGFVVEPSGSRIVLKSDTDSVVLMQPVQTDAPLIFGLVNSNREHLGQFTEVATTFSSLEAVQKIIANDGNPNLHRFGIWDRETLVGMINLSVFGRNSLLDLWVGKEHAGQRYAARAGSLLISYAFDKLDLQDVGCYINLKNEASRKTVQRLKPDLIPAYLGVFNMRYTISNPNTPVPNVAL